MLNVCFLLGGAILGDSRNFKRQAKVEEVGHWGPALGSILSLALPFLLCFLPWHEVNSLPTPYTLAASMFCLSTDPKTQSLGTSY